METLTSDQVIALAPDAASVKAGQGLANPGKWVSLGRDQRSVWGECQGSGKLPYRTQADLSGPAFHCSCPSRKFPCKHGLGLLLLLAANPARVAEGEAPAWVGEWIAKRDANSEKKAARAAEETAPADPETAARRAAEREKRAEKREERVRAGLAELQTWLNDVIRQGLAHAKQQPTQFFDTMAARMIDAQAPGVARRLREWPGLLASGEQWADRVLASAGALQWLLHGFQRMEELPPAMRASVRNAIGWTVSDQELLGAETLRDAWQVIGQVVEEEERLRVQRVWLTGTATQRNALVLSFAAANQPLDVSLVVGTVVEAELVFFPAAAPLRAQVRQRYGDSRALLAPVGAEHFEAALDASATLFAGDPWIDRVPWLVRDCVPLIRDDGWILRDVSGNVVPLGPSFAMGWNLFALSGGHPLTIGGEWDGATLLPLAAWAEGRLIPLGGGPR
jgi:hypothetical protein